MHSLSSISVGAVANCLPPCSVRHSLLMADIHCLPGKYHTIFLFSYIMTLVIDNLLIELGMEGAPVFDKNSGLVGLLMNPLRQNGSSIEVQVSSLVSTRCLCTSNKCGLSYLTIYIPAGDYMGSNMHRMEQQGTGGNWARPK